MTKANWKLASVGTSLLASLLWTPLSFGEGQGKAANSDARAGARERAEAGKWETVVAEVNGDVITREQLADELIEVHGKELLENIVNRKMIEQACKAKKIVITRVDVENELKEKLATLNLSRKEFIERVLGPQDVTFPQYLRDTIWPAVALKRLVSDHVQVTEEDLEKAFEANFGEKVDCRMIVVLEPKKAQDVWEEVNAIKGLEARVEKFEQLAKERSIDQATRSLGGRTQPINRHSATPNIEKTAFALEPGELSKIMQVPTGDPQAPSGNLILLCVQRIPKNDSVTMESVFNEKTKETVRDALTKDIREKKLRQEVTNLYLALRKEAKIENYLTSEFSAKALEETQPAATAPTQKGN